MYFDFEFYLSDFSQKQLVEVWVLSRLNKCGENQPGTVGSGAEDYQKPTVASDLESVGNNAVRPMLELGRYEGELEVLPSQTFVEGPQEISYFKETWRRNKVNS